MFHDAAVVIQEYDEFCTVNDYMLDKILVCARIQGGAEWINEEEGTGGESGKEGWGTTYTIIVNEDIINPSKFLRARVYLDVHIPLVRFVPITIRIERSIQYFTKSFPTFASFVA